MKEEMYTNIPSDGDDQVGRLLSGLPRVSAPSDFDLRLRGRIARRKSSPASGFRLPAAVTYALGLGVVLVAFGLIGAAWMYSGNVTDVPVVAVSEKVTSAPSTSVPDVRVPDPETKPPVNMTVASKPADTGVMPRPAVNSPKSAVAPPVAPATSGTMTDSALKTARSVYPKGIRPDASVSVTDPSPRPAGSVAAKDLVSTLGANISVVGGRLRVDSVTPGSSAANAGIEPGDVILSINDQLITQSTGFAGNVIVTRLRVLRGGKLVPIVLGK